MKIKRKLKNVLQLIIIFGILLTSFIIIDHFVILTRIYYKITYEGTIQHLESIIEKSELFDYQKYCKYRDCSGDVHFVSNSDDYYHIDRDFIESLKLKVEDDKGKFHFWPFYSHKLLYSLEATNESLIYLTYNNNSIIKAEYTNRTEIFTAKSGCYGDINLYQVGNWYLNFTQIPFAPNNSSTIVLHDIFLVKMNLYYDYVYGNVGAEGLIIEQFLCFNSNLQNIFVYFPLEAIVWA